MNLIVWRSTCPNPCDDPEVKISIAPAEGGGTRNVFPWVLPIEEARRFFGPIVDEITETPVEAVVSMNIYLKSEDYKVGESKVFLTEAKAKGGNA
jgi:hypothetical protein